MNREVKEILGVAGVCLAIICVVYFRSRQEPEAIHYGSGAPHLSTEKLDTVKRERYSVEAAPYIFETAFFADTRDRLYGKTVQFFGVNIGKIEIESGKIVACDGSIQQDTFFRQRRTEMGTGIGARTKAPYHPRFDLLRISC